MSEPTRKEVRKGLRNLNRKLMQMIAPKSDPERDPSFCREFRLGIAEAAEALSTASDVCLRAAQHEIHVFSKWVELELEQRAYRRGDSLIDTPDSTDQHR